MQGDMNLAPPPVMVKYLAVLRRFFAAAQAARDPVDPIAAVMIGHLADALHNVPQILWCHDPKAWYKPDNVERWVKYCPHDLEQRGAPRTVVTQSHAILSFAGAARELNLSDDLSEYELAPPVELERSLDLIANSLVEMRTIRNHGVRPASSWDGIRARWTQDAGEESLLNSLMATALQPLPLGLVRWSAFNEPAFYANAAALIDRVPIRHQEHWRRICSSPCE